VEVLEERVNPNTALSLDTTTHVLTINVDAGETATIAVVGTQISVTDNTLGAAVTADASAQTLGFAASNTPTNTSNDPGGLVNDTTNVTAVDITSNGAGGGTVALGQSSVLNVNWNLTVDASGSAAGTFDLASSQTVNALAGTGTITDSVSGGTLTVTGGGTFSGNITGAAALTVGDTGTAETLTLSGNNTYSGLTTIDTLDTLKAGSATALSNNTSVSALGTLDLDGNGGTIGAFTGSATGVLMNSSTTAATLTVTAPSALDGATVEVTLNDATPALATLLTVGARGSIDLTGGQLDLTLVASAPPDAFAVVNGASSGTFAGLPNNSVVDSGTEHFLINYGAAAVTLTDVTNLDTASLSGTVFVDGAGTGTLNAGDYRILGATVTLTGTISGTGTTADGTTVDVSVGTDANGNFVFQDLFPSLFPPDGYTLTVVQPSIFLDGEAIPGTLNGTPGDNIVSNIDVTTGAAGTGYLFPEGGLIASQVSKKFFLADPPPFILPAGSGVATVDPSGFVFLDLHGTGVRTADDPGIAGVRITLSGKTVLGQSVVESTLTNALGFYDFGNLAPGTYTLTDAPPAGYRSGPLTVGSLGGLAGIHQFTNIVLAPGARRWPARREPGPV